MEQWTEADEKKLKELVARKERVSNQDYINNVAINTFKDILTELKNGDARVVEVETNTSRFKWMEYKTEGVYKIVFKDGSATLQINRWEK